MNIIMASDDRGVDMMLVAVYSIIKNNVGNNLFFYIIHTDLSSDSQARIRKLVMNFKDRVTVKLVLVDKDFFNNIELTNETVSMPAYYRYLAPIVIPGESRVLYMDIDMMCIGPLKSLYDTNLDNYYIGAVEDYFVSQTDDYPGFKQAIGFKKTDKYANSGLQLMNLSKIRQDSMMEVFWKNIHRKSDLIPDPFNIFADQTVMNITFKNKIKFLDKKYNVLTTALKYTKHKNAIIVHFAGPDKPFTYRDSYSAKYNDIYYDYYNECMNIVGSNGNEMIKNTIRRLGKETTDAIRCYRDIEQLAKDKANHVDELYDRLKKNQRERKVEKERIEKLEKALRDIENSHSWRLTYPLRRAVKIIRDFNHAKNESSKS